MRGLRTVLWLLARVRVRQENSSVQDELNQFVECRKVSNFSGLDSRSDGAVARPKHWRSSPLDRRVAANRVQR